MQAVAARKSRLTQRAPMPSCRCRLPAVISPKAASGPSATQKTAKRPTASTAASLTTASAAMAATTPWWRSFSSSVRVPKRMVKSASPAAAQKAMRGSCSAVPPVMIS